MKSLLILSLSILITLGMSDAAIAHGEKNAQHQRSESDLARDKTSKPQQILDFLGLKKGDKVLDFLGGTGYYSELIARRVGSNGKVVLHTNQAYMKYIDKGLKERIASGGLDNVTRLLSEANDLKFGENQFDAAILVLGYHDFFHTDKDWDFSADRVMPQLVKSLKKGGKLLVIDHDGAKGSGISASKSLHRIEASYAKQDLLKRGFKFVKETDILRNDQDTLDTLVFDSKIRRKTNRFVYLFEKK